MKRIEEICSKMPTDCAKFPSLYRNRGYIFRGGIPYSLRVNELLKPGSAWVFFSKVT